MNKKILKDYAPKARTAFIQAITDKAALYGITENSVLPCEVRGDFAFINGRPFPRIVNTQRRELLNQIDQHSFSYVMEEIAYTWFNRFAAIRFMEVNGYLSHGYRVLSHPEGHNIPEIVEKAQFVEMTGLDKEEVIQLKMAGDRDDELYRRLLMAQCNELSSAMPFLFEKVDDPTELLLPDNLLHTGSIIRDMVETISEEDWREVEIIGWLYQFYISEKKSALITAKKAYKSEDIPAVTQLFTPNWIVRYLIQNTLGAKWMRTYPTSSLKAKMEYYIEPAEQTPEVDKELRKITPSSLDPEELTILDPACGSGHILVEAYDLLKEIYLERGYRRRDIPHLILEKNLFGLEIDDRAAQLAGFALMMKARRDDSGLFGRGVQPNIVIIKGAKGQKVSGEEAIDELAKVFENAENFGSLIHVPGELLLKLPGIKRYIQELEKSDLFARTSAELLKQLVRQVELLSQRYDVVVANPPYMGNKGMNAKLKSFVKRFYKDEKGDLYCCFIRRNISFANDSGLVGMITIPNWMFSSSFGEAREAIVRNTTISSLIHNGRGVWGSDFGSCSFILCNIKSPDYRGTYRRLFDKQGSIASNEELIERFFMNISYYATMNDFGKIPGLPIAYWASDNIREIFLRCASLKEIASPLAGMSTGNNSLFQRSWYEVSSSRIGFGFETAEDTFSSVVRWVPCNSGGDFRKWYGNNNVVVDWQNDGERIRGFVDENGKLRSAPRNTGYYFKPGITWTKISISNFAARLREKGFAFDDTGRSAFPQEELQTFPILAFLCCKLADHFLRILNPSMSYTSGDIGHLPIEKSILLDANSDNIRGLVDIAREDWNFFETSWDFLILPIPKCEITESQNSPFHTHALQSIYASYDKYRTLCRQMTSKMRDLEEENNQIFIESYGLQDEMIPDVSIEEITLSSNPKYRYKGDLSDDELEVRFREDTMKELISYAVGCMMGRYSLDDPGLIYAHSGNVGFDASKYKTFPADEDGIIPITDLDWFDDDAAFRFFRFIEAAWAKEGLEDNLDFIADVIGRRARKSSRETIRRYFVNDFFKGHLKTYKRRPIYWLFSSGKQKAFQALVYLHRYNEGTLSRMRTEYVLPLQSRLSRHIESLEKDREAASSTSAANKIQREIDKLRKQREELLRFDEKLRHYADMRIKLDLDDGVKVNYGKFGDLLAEVKAVTGKK